jgi:hypothetical protein
MALGGDDLDGESLGADVGTSEGVLVGKAEVGVLGASEGPEDFEGEALGADVGPSEGELVGEGVGPGVGNSDGAELGADVGDDVGSEEGAGVSVSKSSQVMTLTPSSMYTITLATSGGPVRRPHTFTTRSSLPSQLLKRSSPLFSSKLASNQLWLSAA